MDKLRKIIFFSGRNTEKNDAASQAHQEFYCEGQNINDPIVKEEREEVKKKETKKSRFFANYNMFF
ncbi:MAG: hypothetical protein LBV74_08690 [Tannerella sp.]|nr:hypothetical protein [Tannerella sp.]